MTKSTNKLINAYKFEIIWVYLIQEMLFDKTVELEFRLSFRFLW